MFALGRGCLATRTAGGAARHQALDELLVRTIGGAFVTAQVMMHFDTSSAQVGVVAS